MQVIKIGRSTIRKTIVGVVEWELQLDLDHFEWNSPMRISYD